MQSRGARLLFAPWMVTGILAGLGSRQTEGLDLIQNTLYQPPVVDPW